MELKDRIDSECKTALKSGEKIKVSTLRMILAEVKNAEIAKRGDLSEEELLAVVAREARKRKESIEEFGRGGREDLVAKESEELAIIQAYLPEQMSDGEVRSIVEETIKEVGATSSGDLGKVMGKLMPKIKGKADGKKVNQMVREMLQS
ncbi:MAG TPA: GatB/YqeY domain-containing protein [Candidatus Anoxymicrobiaceae bacterium]